MDDRYTIWNMLDSTLDDDPERLGYVMGQLREDSPIAANAVKRWVRTNRGRLPWSKQTEVV